MVAHQRLILAGSIAGAAIVVAALVVLGVILNSDGNKITALQRAVQRQTAALHQVSTRLSASNSTTTSTTSLGVPPVTTTTSCTVGLFSIPGFGPEPGYTVKITNREAQVIAINSWAVLFRNSGGTQTGSDSEQTPATSYVAAHQSMTWQPTPGYGAMWIPGHLSGFIDTNGMCEVVSVGAVPVSQ